MKVPSDDRFKKLIYVLLIALLILVLYYAWPAFIAVAGFILRLFLPIILAFLFALLLEPLVTISENRLHLPRGASTLLVMVVILGGGILFLGFLIYRLVNEILILAQDFPLYVTEIFSDFTSYWQQLQDIYHNLALPANIQNMLEDILPRLIEIAQNFLSDLSNSLLGFAASLPQNTIAFIFFLLALYFLLKDWQLCKKVLFNPFGQWRQKAVGIFDQAQNGFARFVGAELLLVSITTVCYLLGYMILGARFAWFLGILTGILDILPVVGPGIIIVPWAIIALFTGNWFLAIALLVLYGIISALRYILEPKVVGESIGVHPLEVLIAIYAGLEAFGFVGLIIFPLLLILFHALWDAGIFQRKDPEESQNSKI